MNSHFHRVVGIDLGTTFSAVAAHNTYTGQCEIINNNSAESDRNPATTPSVVSLHPALRRAIVGWGAKRNIVQDPQNTIIEIKREMGEDFRDDTLAKFGAQNLYRKGDPVKAHFAGEWRLPQEMSALILMKMKEIAEAEIGEEIRDAVITVPAYFTAKQRKATEEAALLAGLYPRQLIPEPTAAAICYGVDTMNEDRKVYLVYDLGGGTFDVSIIEVEEANISVIATAGDPRLGGGDFDDKITEWAIGELKRLHNLDVGTDPIARARVKSVAEQAKIRLSAHLSTTLEFPDLFAQQPPSLTLSREKFEELVESLLNKAISYVDMAIRMAQEKKGIQRDQIDAILLVGGSSKIPRVKRMLLDSFGKGDSFIRGDLNPDEVVARGAAIMAQRFTPSLPPFNIAREVDNSLVSHDADDVHVQLITEHSLGLGIQDNVFSKIIDQGSNIPVEVMRDGYSNPGPVDHIDVLVYQGEGKYVYENTLIGTLTIGPMEPKEPLFHKFNVTFKLDENGLLSVVIHHVNEGKSYQAKFDHKTGVGGKDALAAVRSKLLRLYADRASLAGARPPSSLPPVPPEVVPPPPPVSTTAVPPPTSAVVPPPPPGVQPPPSTGAVPPPPSPIPASTIPSPASSSNGGAAIPGLLEPAPEIPAEFKRTVRQARKKLAETGHPPLLRAYNAFVSALNGGAGQDELEELGDTLDAIAHDTPTGPVIIGPTAEVPAQFKAIIRRAHKQLMESIDPELLSAFNAFTSALNAGTPEDDLEQLGDTLDDVYHNVRK